MAGVSLLALLDDITSLLDDVSVMTKVAARKTAGVLGDDLAVNAEKVTGVAAARELPVVFAVFRGSLLNKAILVPAALLIATIAPWLIGPLLIAGGLFLCFEGFEKVWHSLGHSEDTAPAHAEQILSEGLPERDAPELEKRRIRGAIRTDFILSLEIIVITLGIVADEPLLVRASVLAGIALLMTIGVYGLVAAIVKMDDAGLHLAQLPGKGLHSLLRFLGRGLVAFAPKLMKGLTIVGTIAMFLVGGGILVHGVPAIHHASEWFVAQILPGNDGLVALLLPQLFAAALGLVVGGIVLLFVAGAQRLKAVLSPAD